jgi:hypothetical protein
MTHRMKVGLLSTAFFFLAVAIGQPEVHTDINVSMRVVTQGP